MQPAPIIPPLPPLATTPPPRLMQASTPKRDIVLPSYVIPLAVAALVVTAIIALPKFLSKGVESSSSSTTAKARAAAPGPEGQPASSDGARSAKLNASSSREALKSSPAKPAAKESSQPAAKEAPQPAAAAPSPASLRTETKPADDSSTSATSSSATGSGKGEVLDQILPDVPEKALATISGKVRVSVRAHVDAAGNVSSAEFESPGPSKYFADAALKAVRRWEFTSPEAGGRSVPSEWLVRFEFKPSGVKAFPQQITP
jgi:protein TonB